MADPKSLLPARMVASRAFRDDVRKLLVLPVSTLQLLDSLIRSGAGFSSEQVLKFAGQAVLSIEEARSVLNVTEYLYDRLRDERIALPGAIDEIISLGQELEIPGLAEKRAALEALLSTKEQHERTRYAQEIATSVVPHFGGVHGVWDVRPVFRREGDGILTKVLVLLLRVSWHSDAGPQSEREAVFQLGEDDWKDLRETLEDLERRRSLLREELDRE